jgi:plastocyanin
VWTRRLAPAAILGLVGAPQSSAPAATLRVVMQDLAYHGAPREAHIGDVVVWSNRDFVDHTATAQGGGFDVAAPAGRTVRIVLKRPGRIAFFCRFHPQMRG